MTLRLFEHVLTHKYYVDKRKKFGVKATVELEVKTEIVGIDHDDIKRRLTEKLIRENFSNVKIKYIRSTLLETYDEDDEEE